MTFYRVTWYIEDGKYSEGYSWHCSKAEALHEIKQKLRADAPGDPEAIEIIPTKAGILRTLRRFAEHPNNE